MDTFTQAELRRGALNLRIFIVFVVLTMSSQAFPQGRYETMGIGLQRLSNACVGFYAIKVAVIDQVRRTRGFIVSACQCAAEKWFADRIHSGETLAGIDVEAIAQSRRMEQNVQACVAGGS